MSASSAGRRFGDRQESANSTRSLHASAQVQSAGIMFPALDAFARIGLVFPNQVPAIIHEKVLMTTRDFMNPAVPRIISIVDDFSATFGDSDKTIFGIPGQGGIGVRINW